MHARLILLAFLTASTYAQAPLTPPQVALESDVDSGYLTNGSDSAKVVFRHRFQVADTAWLQFRFEATTNLPAGSVLRLTAVNDDNAWQQHDALTLGEWNMDSAAFNGETVVLELIAGPKTRGNHVSVERVIRGLHGVTPEPETTCGLADNRVQSDDKRQGRLYLGCTGWLAGPVANNTRDLMLTAGHCQGTTNILELNVPNSTPGGVIVRSAPDDQYPYTTVQRLNGGQGADWQVCQVGRNSNTGLLPTEANGGLFYNLGTVPSSPTGQSVTVTGYGSTTPPNYLFAVQKTHTGPLSQTSFTLCYGVDTSGGNSGSPVIDATTGEAIGIHTHGGCTATGGCNSGTRIDRADLQAALAAAGKLLGSFTTFGAGCTGTGSLPALCNSLNPNGGTLVNRRASYRFAYGASAETTLDVAAFEIFSYSTTGGDETVPTAIYAANASGKPAGTPLATGTMTIGPTPGFYRTYLNATIPPGQFFVAVDHRGNKTTLSNLTLGTSSSGFYYSGGNWNPSTSWAGRPSYRIYCEGGGGPAEPRMTGTGVPKIGGSYSIDISLGRASANAVLMTGYSTTQWGGIPLPFSLAPFGAPGCNVLVNGILQVGTQLDATGTGSLSLTVPNSQSLVGVELHHQWYVVDAPANLLGIAWSGGATSTIGS